MGWFDVHAHLTHSRFEGDLEAVISRAAQAGVTTIISNGLNPLDNKRVLDLAQTVPLVKPAVGFYPVDVVLQRMVADGVPYPREDEPLVSPQEGVDSVRALAPQAIAVGEIGLDHHWVPEDYWAAQEAVFRELVQIALDLDKPIIIHTRKAERRTFEILKEMGAERVDWHCFGSKVKLAKQIAEHGHWLSIPANARKSQSFTKMLATLPRERLLLETDCPYLGPVRGERNEPANVAGTAAYAAELWECSLEEVQATVERNFTELFGFAP